MTTIFNSPLVFLSVWYSLTPFSIFGSLLFCFQLPVNALTSPPFPPNLPLSLSSASSFFLCHLYRGNKLLAIPVTDTALIRYSSALSPTTLYSHSAFSFSYPCTGIFSWQSGTAQHFSDCCCTLEKTNKQTKKCVMIVLLLYLLNDKAI